MELTQLGCITDLYEDFKHMIPKRKVTTPMPAITTANKSVRMNYHWVQEAVEGGIVDMRRVDTDDNTADVFTKTLGTDVITRLRPGLTGYGPLPPIPCATPI